MDARYHAKTRPHHQFEWSLCRVRPVDVNPFELFKMIGGPGSIGFLVATLLVGALLRRYRPRHPLAWRTIVGVVCGLYLLLSLPVVGYSIAGWLPPFMPGERPSRGSLDTLVIFDGDNRRGRLREGLRVWNEATPKALIVSGGDWLVDRLREAGIPDASLTRDATAGNTRTQVAWTVALAAARPGERIGVVASTLQMPRIEALMQASGLRVTLLPSPIDAEPAAAGWRAWVPSYLALRLSRDALYEVAALRYYAGKGWIQKSEVKSQRSEVRGQKTEPS